MTDLRYPIGHFTSPEEITEDIKQKWIQTLEDFPLRLENLVKDLSEEQLETPYRDGGWTVRQVVHHCADSHHNSYIRFKWALTEENPLIKAYNEADWAELFDTKTGPINMSILHLKAVHAKLVYLLRGLSDSDLKKTFIHPESKEAVLLLVNIGIYAWHCNHHYAHIEHLLIRKGWK
ncbi:YfiT family bacillithiol transferase [Pseudotenacibaculum sp. MALMAid0570]|uniref:YfiT family bacillithiol transferase n=1 Tax=Pseudotenacibaculum sp. MALMAid0570 TaxID=3143938 RepID=UPI0032E04535